MTFFDRGSPPAPSPSTRSRDWTSNILLLAAGGLLALVLAKPFFQTEPDLVGKPAPPLVFRQLDGTALSLSALAGNVVLIDFWSLACGPCVSQMPILSAIETRFRHRPFRLLSLNVEPSEWPHAGEWQKRQIPASLGGSADSPTARAYGATRLPRLVLIAPDGMVANGFTGRTDEATLIAAIDRVFAK